MTVHDEVLQEARRQCTASGSWRFMLRDVVAALPHLNEGSVRTHITARCCVNAPKNHPHRWDYFRRVARGTYAITEKYRSTNTGPAEVTLRDAIHVTVTRSEGRFTAECLEVAVVTEGRDLNSLLRNLREALLLHFENEDLAALGLTSRLRLLIMAEFPLAISA